MADSDRPIYTDGMGLIQYLRDLQAKNSPPRSRLKACLFRLREKLRIALGK